MRTQTVVDRRLNTDTSFNLFDSYKVIAIDTEKMDKGSSIEFSDTLVVILSESMLKNNMNLLSKEQYKTISRFYAQADTGLVDDDLIQLNVYLGSV